MKKEEAIKKISDAVGQIMDIAKNAESIANANDLRFAFVLFHTTNTPNAEKDQQRWGYNRVGTPEMTFTTMAKFFRAYPQVLDAVMKIMDAEQQFWNDDGTLKIVDESIE